MNLKRLIVEKLSFSQLTYLKINYYLIFNNQFKQSLLFLAYRLCSLNFNLPTIANVFFNMNVCRILYTHLTRADLKVERG